MATVAHCLLLQWCSAPQTSVQTLLIVRLLPVVYQLSQPLSFSACKFALMSALLSQIKDLRRPNPPVMSGVCSPLLVTADLRNYSPHHTLMEEILFIHAVGCNVLLNILATSTHLGQRDLICSSWSVWPHQKINASSCITHGQCDLHWYIMVNVTVSSQQSQHDLIHGIILI